MTASKPNAVLDLAQFDGFGPGTWRAENGSIKALSHGTWTTVSVVHRSRFTPEGRAAIANVQAAAPALLAECKRQRAEYAAEVEHSAELLRQVQSKAEQIKALREALQDFLAWYTKGEIGDNVELWSNARAALGTP